MPQCVRLLCQGPAQNLPGEMFPNDGLWNSLFVIWSRGEQHAVHVNDLSRTYVYPARFGPRESTVRIGTEGHLRRLLGLPDAARTAQMQDGKSHIKSGTYL